MLLRYIVSNYKSIGHPVEFSMVPKEGETDEKYLRNIETADGNWQVLCRGGFFGPNASGKTSFIESVAFARNYIVNGRKSGRGTGVIQFKGDIEELREVSTFQFVFYLNGTVYDYGFSINKRQVCEEWLMQLTKAGFSSVFSRTTDENGLTVIDTTSRLSQSGSKQRMLVEVLKESIKENQKNQLFLVKLSENGVRKAEKIVAWFESIQVIFPGSRIRALPIRMKENQALEDYIGEKLKQLDTGVTRVYTESIKVDFDEFAEKLGFPEELVDNIKEAESGIFVFDDKCFIFSGKKKTMLVQLRLEHILNQKEIKLNLDEESDGTRRLLDLLPMLFLTGQSNSVFFIDEIDRSLHTKLSQYLLTEFVKRADSGNNQIVFTAHDINLINLRLFRQDEIWFFEKNKAGESVLKPLSDFQIQDGTDSVKDYLAGRFGAVPVIRRE